MDLNETRRKRPRLYAELLTDAWIQNSSLATKVSPHVASMAAAESGQPPLDAARELQSFRGKIPTRCAGCGSQEVDLDALVEATSKELTKWQETGVSLSATTFCLRCSATTCLGCGDTCTKENGVAWHCAKGRLVCAWVLLCSFDRTIAQDTARQRSGYEQTSSEKSDKGLPSGVGYGGYEKEPEPVDAYIDDKVSSDEILENATKTLSTLLSDAEVSPIVNTMLVRSSLMDSIADLLKNDSIEDVAGRWMAYEPVLKLTQLLVSHDTTKALVTEDRVVKRGSQHLFSFPSSNKHSATLVESEFKSQSIFACLLQLAIQSGVMLEKAAKAREDFQSVTDKNILEMSQHVLDLHYVIEQANKATKGLEDGQGLASYPWQKALAVSQRGSRIQQFTKCRTARLVKEITSMSTSLPEGIFVRHAASRPDVMKVLITGPVGTPYENGLFEFDLVCGPEYPTKPPQMFFRTTGGGTVHFNPNLYPDGKVCLSLLGTWDGPGWDAKKSTLTQLLISVQAFILTEEPICNEPGSEGLHGRAESKAFNCQLYPLTVKYAIIFWLYILYPERFNAARFEAGRDPATIKTVTTTSVIWSDILILHFQSSEAAIMATLDRWLAEIIEERKRRNEEELERKEKDSGLSNELAAFGESSSKLSSPKAPLLPTELEFMQKLVRAQKLVFEFVGPWRNLHQQLEDELDDEDNIDDKDDIDEKDGDSLAEHLEPASLDLMRAE